MNPSALTIERIFKVALTLKDLDASENIIPEHLVEAIHFRSLDLTRHES
ncbi:MAG: hypothetical protein KQI35_16550 [Bacteroidetes bacterium]|nr:hypothetical protein [Bacteroidota bacterium]